MTGGFVYGLNPAQGHDEKLPKDLSKMFLRYGNHLIGCSIHRNPALGCSCGWTKVRKQLQEQ